MSNFIQTTPFIYVDSLETALAFFRDRLGFEVSYRLQDYAYVRRETVGIRLAQNTEDVSAPAGNGRYAYYVDVRDVDELYAELAPKLEALPAGQVSGPLDQPYGQRELSIVAPDGNLIVFGQMIEPTGVPGRPLELSGRDVRGSRFTNSRLANSAFAKVDLSGSTFDDVNAAATAFTNVSLREARFTNVNLSAVEIAHSRLAGMRIEGILVTDLIAAYRASKA